MFCRNCGSYVVGSDKFCSECGAVINNSNIENDNGRPNIHNPPPQSYENLAMNNRPISLYDNINGKSMKWFNVFVRYIIPIRVVLGVLTYYTNMSNSIEEGIYDDYFSAFSDDLFGVMNTFQLVFVIILTVVALMSWKKLKGFENRGYQYIMLYFSMEIAFFLLIEIIIIVSLMNGFSCSLEELFSSSDVISSFINDFARFIGSMAFVVPNIIYFYKRKHLFVN